VHLHGAITANLQERMAPRRSFKERIPQMKSLRVFPALALMLTIAGAAWAADTRTGTVTEIRTHGDGNIRVKLDHGSQELCGNNSATSWARLDLTAPYFETGRTLLTSAVLSGRQVKLIMTDTGTECRIDDVRLLND
jgi:hypothetical protein